MKKTAKRFRTINMTTAEISTLRIHNDRPLEPERVKELAQSMDVLGLLNPVTIDQSGNLLAGRRRVAAAKKLGWTRIDVHVLDIDEVRGELATIDENLTRDELSLLDRAERLSRRKVIFETLGRADFKATAAGLSRMSPRSVEQEIQISANIGSAAKKQIRGTAFANSKRDLLALARIPEDRQVRAIDVATKHAIPIREAVLKLNREKQIRLVKTAQTPEGEFAVIVSDPSWRYGLRNEDPSHRNRVDYPTMSVEEICDYGSVIVKPGGALPEFRSRAAFAAPNAALWLWTTKDHLLAEAPTVISAWGFTPKQIFPWYKGDEPGEAWISTGHYGRNVYEYLILAVRGSPVFDHAFLARQENAIFEKRRETGRKPEKAWQLIEAACPSPSRLELFSREHRPGWTCLGAEVGKFNVAEGA